MEARGKVPCERLSLGTSGRRALLVLALVAWLLASIPARADYEVVEVRDAGTLAGRVTFVGELPALAPVPVAKDQEVCGHTVPPDGPSVAPDGRGVRDAVISLEGVARGKALTPGAATLENRGCRFVPHVQAVPLGTELTTVNADPLLHNVRGRIGDRVVLNVVQPSRGQRTARELRRPGTIALGCDVHPNMRAFLLVFPHPYFAQTDAAGLFRISGIPPGTYQVRMWHPGWVRLRAPDPAGERYEEPHVLTREVRVPPGGEVMVSFELSERRW